MLFFFVRSYIRFLLVVVYVFIVLCYFFFEFAFVIFSLWFEVISLGRILFCVFFLRLLRVLEFRFSLLGICCRSLLIVSVDKFIVSVFVSFFFVLA